MQQLSAARLVAGSSLRDESFYLRITFHVTLLSELPSAREYRVFGFPFFTARLPRELATAAAARFEELWELHPAEFYEMRQPGTGKAIPVPRWQQAFGRDYRNSGNVTLKCGEVTVETSIGVMLFPSYAHTASDVSRNADLALHRAKVEGRGRVVFFKPEMLTAIQTKNALARDLRSALSEDIGLSVHYQPQVDLVTGRVIGFEGLMRWNHPTRGHVPPSEFIPVAESSRLICDLGLWVLRKAAIQAKVWLDAGEPPREVAVNMSAAQIWHTDVVGGRCFKPAFKAEDLMYVPATWQSGACWLTAKPSGRRVSHRCFAFGDTRCGSAAHCQPGVSRRLIQVQDAAVVRRPRWPSPGSPR
jgi:hypothetical protein